MEDPVVTNGTDATAQEPEQMVVEVEAEAPKPELEPMDQQEPNIPSPGPEPEPTETSIDQPSCIPEVSHSPAVSSYTPQFSATQASILALIRDNEAAARSSLTSDTTSKPGPQHPSQLAETLPMPTPLGQLTLTAAARIDAANISSRLALKRKWDEEHEPRDREREREREGDVDFSQSTMAFPPPRWMPPREDEDLRHAEDEVERLRARNLTALARGVVPAKPELVGFLPGRASDLALSTYFYGKKRTDMLNVLAFSDQLRPQLLVDILVSVVRKNPDLPIFDSPNWNPDPPPPRPQHRPITNGQYDHHRRPRHGHVIAPGAKPRHKQQKTPTSRKPVKPSLSAPLGVDAADGSAEPGADEDAGADDNDALPATWPKAEEGLYAKLKAEDEDRMFLMDENDEEAFSHFAVDKYGKQIAVLVPATA